MTQLDVALRPARPPAENPPRRPRRSVLVTVLGVVAVQVETARQAVGLLHGAHRRGMVLTQGHDVLVSSSAETVPVGIDGESVHLSTPVHCTVHPGALRVRLPRERPGVT